MTFSSNPGGGFMAASGLSFHRISPVISAPIDFL